jgi:3-methyl-2-oxobutanoate hydroxymethyltransferase
VFEAIPAEVTDLVMQHMQSVVIGIGAGPSTDGQVLVLHDLLGVHTGHVAKFVRRFADVRGEMLSGVTAYADAVRGRAFPAAEHTYSIPPEELERLRARPPRRRSPAYDW